VLLDLVQAGIQQLAGERAEEHAGEVAGAGDEGLVAVQPRLQLCCLQQLGVLLAAAGGRRGGRGSGSEGAVREVSGCTGESAGHSPEKHTEM